MQQQRRRCEGRPGRPEHTHAGRHLTSETPPLSDGEIDHHTSRTRYHQSRPWRPVMRSARRQARSPGCPPPPIDTDKSEPTRTDANRHAYAAREHRVAPDHGSAANPCRPAIGLLALQTQRQSSPAKHRPLGTDGVANHRAVPQVAVRQLDASA
jgi:hypothetical protein